MRPRQRYPHRWHHYCMRTVRRWPFQRRLEHMERVQEMRVRSWERECIPRLDIVRRGRQQVRQRFYLQYGLRVRIRVCRRCRAAHRLHLQWRIRVIIYGDRCVRWGKWHVRTLRRWELLRRWRSAAVDVLVRPRIGVRSGEYPVRGVPRRTCVRGGSQFERGMPSWHVLPCRVCCRATLPCVYIFDCRCRCLSGVCGRMVRCRQQSCSGCSSYY